MKGRLMQVTEVMDVVRRDIDFYESSGGGATLSGGEPLFQPEFVLEILRACLDQKINTALETAGYVPWESIEAVIPFTDLFLYDIKHLDADKHKEYTGVSNDLILENLKKLIERNCKIIVRTPVIPGFNDTEAEIQAIARYIASIGIQKYCLLPYHRYGLNKYACLGRKYQLHDDIGQVVNIEELKKSASTQKIEVYVEN
jgi:pyruvate formate lyase activating enzyme